MKKVWALWNLGKIGLKQFKINYQPEYDDLQHCSSAAILLSYSMLKVACRGYLSEFEYSKF